VKTFYTERDIIDLYQAGVTELEVDEDVVLTDVARERATGLGMVFKLTPQPTTPGPALKTQTPPPAEPPTRISADITNDPEQISRIKAAVIARLGTTEHNSLLDQIIPEVLARIESSNAAGNTPSSDY
jgi:hypothetical protein